jgi:phage tail tape-measure protein
MERAARTDERLDDLSRRVDAGFARVDAELRELRGEIRGLGSELRGEIDSLRITLLRVGGGVIVGLVGVIAAVLASGG